MEEFFAQQIYRLNSLNRMLCQCRDLYRPRPVIRSNYYLLLLIYQPLNRWWPLCIFYMDGQIKPILGLFLIYLCTGCEYYLGLGRREELWLQNAFINGAGTPSSKEHLEYFLYYSFRSINTEERGLGLQTLKAGKYLTFSGWRLLVLWWNNGDLDQVIKEQIYFR